MRTDIDIFNDLNKVQFEIDELIEKRRKLNQELTEYLSRFEDYDKTRNKDDENN